MADVAKDDEIEKERLIQELEQKNAEEQHQLALEKYNLEVQQYKLKQNAETQLIILQKQQ